MRHVKDKKWVGKNEKLDLTETEMVFYIKGIKKLSKYYNLINAFPIISEI